MAELSISNVINISVAQPGAGAGEYNTSNLALFSSEVPGGGFGSAGYKIYLEPTEVGTDFGTSSETYVQALAVFSQAPNILANSGYLVVIPMNEEIQTLSFSGGTPASGSYKLNYASDITATIAWDAVAADVQAAVRTLTGLEKAVVTGGPAPSSFSLKLYGTGADVALITVSNNTLQTSGMATVTPAVAQATAGETIAAAIARTDSLVQYFGLMGTNIYSQADMLAAAAVVQTLNKIAFFVQSDSASVEVGGALDLLRSGGFSQSRGLFYSSGGVTDPLIMQASYAGRALSVNFNGSLTTTNMHLKDLVSVQPDPSMTQTLLTKCIAAGADSYISIQGIPKVFCSGENDFFDQVYNLRWFVGALQVAGFNVLAETATKIPQTESGVTSLKSAYRQVCEQAVTNGYLAPGLWTSPTTFGNQSDLFDNVAQRGYYIYSQPISAQSPTARAARQAPLIQMAAKEAGAIDSSNVIVNVNA